MISPRIHHFDTVDSTNDVALEMARRGEPEGTVVIGKRQLKGKGRRGRSWWDEPGKSVLMSVILTPDRPPTELAHLSFVASLAVAECLEAKCGLPVSLKWPNDVLVRERKIAGILVETTHVPSGTAAVVGIGVNVNQKEFPPDIAFTATSVALEKGTVDSVDELASALSEGLFANYETFLVEGFEEILGRWRNYMWGLGRQADVAAEGRSLRGTVAGVDSTGALVLRDSLGSDHAIRAADAVVEVLP